MGGTPVSRLPVELVDAIFLLSLLQETTLKPNDDSINFFDRPVSEYEFDEGLKQSRSLSQVSRRWREIALANVNLWDRIALAKWPKKKERVAWIKEVLRRSGKSPLSLLLSISSDWDQEWDELMEPLLLKAIPRIRRLAVLLNYYQLEVTTRLVKCFSSHTFPILERLEILPDTTCFAPWPLRGLDFLFTGAMPKLKHLAFKLNYDYIPYPMLSNITSFSLTANIFYGMPGLSLEKCLELLRAMPLLKDLQIFLPPDFHSDGDSDDDSDEEEDDEDVVHLPQLRRFRLDSACVSCALLLPMISVPPGCSVQVYCMDSEFDDDYATVLKEVLRLARESALDATDKSLQINPRHNLITVILDPPNSSSGSSPDLHFFKFSTNVKRPPLKTRRELEHARATQLYFLFILVARSILCMELTRASEIVLRVYTKLFAEVGTAPVFVSLLRACNSAQRLLLTGFHNEFMIPLLSHIIYGTGQNFKEVLFSDLELCASDPGEWDADLDDMLDPETWPLGTFDQPGLEYKGPLKVVNFLRTDFDIASAEGIQNLADVVCWKELQAIVQKHLRLAIFRDAKGRSSNYSGEVTMAHVMKRILGPKTKDSPASSEWLCKALAYDLEFE